MLFYDERYSMQKKRPISFKVDENLADEFLQVAKSNNRTMALLFRDYMVEYIRQNKQNPALNFDNIAKVKDLTP